MRTSVLVVVPTLGTRLPWLREAILSITTQDIDPLPLIRVVAPSQARSALADLCAELGAELVISDRKGLSAAINDGWRDAKNFEFVTWLGDDDLLAPHALRRAVEFLRRQPPAVAVYGQIRYVDPSGNTLWFQRPGSLAPIYMKVGKNLVPQQGSLIRSSAAARLNGIDENFSSAMDQDLFARLQRLGKLAYIRVEVAAFRLHDSNITITKGSSGEDEGEKIRRRQVGKLYPLIRPFTRLSDKLLYAAIRRSRIPTTPLRDGLPYTQPS